MNTKIVFLPDLFRDFQNGNIKFLSPESITPYYPIYEVIDSICAEYRWEPYIVDNIHKRYPTKPLFLWKPENPDEYQETDDPVTLELIKNWHRTNDNSFYIVDGVMRIIALYNACFSENPEYTIYYNAESGKLTSEDYEDGLCITVKDIYDVQSSGKIALDLMGKIGTDKAMRIMEFHKTLHKYPIVVHELNAENLKEVSEILYGYHRGFTVNHKR